MCVTIPYTIVFLIILRLILSNKMIIWHLLDIYERLNYEDPSLILFYTSGLKR
jgi:hypothetical protein